MDKIEVTKWRSLKVNLGDFQNVDFGVSVKVEVDDTPEEVEKANERLNEYCKKEITNSLNNELKYWAEQVTADRKKELLNQEI